MSSFESAVHALGGDEDDIRLLADIGSEDSGIEESGTTDAGLLNEVDSMWSEISGSNKKGKRTVFDEETKPQKPKEAVVKNSLNNESKKNKNKDQELKAVVAEKPSHISEKSRNNEKQKAKPNPKENPGSQPAKGESKKMLKRRLKAEEWINSLQHPNHVVVETDEELWSSASTDSQDAGESIDITLIPLLKEKARKLLDAECNVYHKQRLQEREYSTSLEFLKSGTFSDQLGTLSILSTESPLHSMRYLENLLAKCEVKNRESACKALEVAKDLLVSHILPDQRLMWFKDMHVSVGSSIKHLILCSFQDWLKQYYFRVILALERLMSDTVVAIRLRSLHVCFDLFKKKPEQEANLLRLGLNKLGDLESRVSSAVKTLVMDVLNTHPMMKPVVASAMSELLARSSDYRTRYYSIDLMSEFIFTHKDSELPNLVIHIYLELFERLLAEWDAEGDKHDKDADKSAPKKDPRKRGPLRGKRGGVRQEQKTASQAEEEQKARLVSKIFTGLNRAFPFSQLHPDSFTKYIDTLYRMSHSPNVGTFIEALGFIYQLVRASHDKHGKIDLRFYRSLYGSLLDERLCRSPKLGKYLHMILRAVAHLSEATEENIAIANSFAKRLIQVSTQWTEVGAAASLAYVTIHVPHLELLLSTKDGVETKVDSYDPMKRDALYSKADTSKLWEIVPLSMHYHPTVSLYAENVMALPDERQALDLPDIEQYTVNNFLNKWSYKKPKEKENTRGGSIFQPLSGYTDLALGIRQEVSHPSVPITLQDWTARKPETVAPDEQFYLEYFKGRPAPKQKPKNGAADLDEISGNAGDDENSDADEEAIYKAMVDTGELGSDISDGDDLSGFEDMSSESEEPPSDVDDDEDDSAGEVLRAARIADYFEREVGDSAEDSSEYSEDSDDVQELENEEPSDSDAELPQSEDTAGAKTAQDANKKRKRAWAEMPTFMDADAFEETIAKRKRS